MQERDYNLYKIFLTLYEQKSISKTADKLFVSQPAISYSLRELESQLGYDLFYRRAKGIEPTLEAKELYSYISTAFNIIKEGENHIDNLNNLNIGVIKIGVPSHIAVYFLSKYVSNFRKIFSGIKFEFISKSTAEMVQMLEERKIDLIIDTLPIKINNKYVEKIFLSNLQIGFVYNKRIHPEYKINCIKDITKYPLLLPSATSSIRTKLDEFMEENDIKLNPVIESWTTELLLEYVKNGLGIGYIIKNVLDTLANTNEFEVVSFNDKLPSLEVCAIYLKEFESAALKKFVDFISNEIKSEMGDK